MNLSEIKEYVSLISHRKFVNSIYNCSHGSKSYSFHKFLFAIHQPFKIKTEWKKISKHLKYRIMTKETLRIRRVHREIKNALLLSLMNERSEIGNENSNKTDVNTHLSISSFFNGGNNSPDFTITEIGPELYLIPKECRFYNNDVSEILKHISDKFDLIVLDPPWWNKYIRRKRSRNESGGYDMMWTSEIANIPIDTLLEFNGLVAVWCTNALSHINALKNNIFPSWGVKFVAEWIWLKVTLNGEVVTPFSSINGKQPYERILFGVKNEKRCYACPPVDKIIVSVPSIIHSHKPPLCDLLKPFVPTEFKGLEIFARNLLPGWTSYGNEVLKLQHLSLFTENNGSKGLN